MVDSVDIGVDFVPVALLSLFLPVNIFTIIMISIMARTIKMAEYIISFSRST